MMVGKCAILWGQCNVVEDALRVVRYRDVFLHQWSIYDRSGRMMRAIGDYILGTSAAAAGPEVDLWLSRTLITSGNRLIVNEAELTDALAGHGIAIAHPERLGFADQIRLWSRVRIGMGFASSAFHTTAFRGGQQLCTLSHDLAASSNQVLIDRVCGNRSLFLHAADGIVDEATTVPGFNAQLTILKPIWLADEIARIADAFRDRRIAPQSVTPLPRDGWKARLGLAPFGEDMSGQGKVTVRRQDARITHWQIAWKTVRSIGAVTLYNRSGSVEVDAVSIDVSGDGVDWATVSSPQSTEARANGDGTNLFTYRSAYPQPARLLRIRVRPERCLDLAEIAVFGERLDAEVGLPEELMHAVLARRAALGTSARIVDAVARTFGRIGTIISGRLSDRER